MQQREASGLFSGGLHTHQRGKKPRVSQGLSRGGPKKIVVSLSGSRVQGVDTCKGGIFLVTKR